MKKTNDLSKLSKTVLILLCLFSLSFFSVKADGARAARSVHLNYSPQAPLAEAAQVTVKVTQCQTNSYYMALGWDFGYCGVQHIDGYGHIVIFSVWDPGDPFDMTAREADVEESKRVKVLYANDLMSVDRFEREGTGAKAMAGLDWKEGEEITFRVESAPDGKDRIAFTCEIKMTDTDWVKLATFSTLCHDERIKGVTNVYSFVEDFWRNGDSAKRIRRAEFSNVKTRSRGGEWIEAKRAYFTGDTTETLNVDAGKTPQGAFFLQTGGETKNEHTPLWSIVGD